MIRKSVLIYREIAHACYTALAIYPSRGLLTLTGSTDGQVGFVTPTG